MDHMYLPSKHRGPDLPAQVVEILVENCLELGLLEEGGEVLGGVEAGEGGDVEAGQPREVVRGQVAVVQQVDAADLVTRVDEQLELSIPAMQR